jgi:tetratricopeptide (TPR) repeat protein
MSIAIASDTISISDALRRARAHWKAGDAGEAERYCERVLAARPDQPDALHLLGLIANAHGDLDLAIDRLRRACLAPRAPAVYSSDLADAYRRNGRLAEAETAARRALAMDSNLVSCWNTLGLVLQEAGKLEESLAAFERVVGLKRNRAEGHNNLGNALRRLGLLEFAAWHYVQALTLDRNFAEAYANIAFFHIAQREYQQAAAAASHAIELNPRLADAYLTLAEAEMLQHRPDAALEALDALCAVAPEHAAGRAARDKVLEQLKRNRRDAPSVFPATHEGDLRE